MSAVSISLSEDKKWTELEGEYFRAGIIQILELQSKVSKRVNRAGWVQIVIPSKQGQTLHLLNYIQVKRKLQFVSLRVYIRFARVSKFIWHSKKYQTKLCCWPRSLWLPQVIHNSVFKALFFYICRSTLSLYDVPPKSSQLSLLAAQDLYDTLPPSRAVSILSASTYRAEDLSE